MSSPPYWAKRQSLSQGIGLEKDYQEYIQNLTTILATCPAQGVVLDPFCGTGTTMLVAMKLGRKSIGIDIAQEYLEIAKSRCHHRSLF